MRSFQALSFTILTSVVLAACSSTPKVPNIAMAIQTPLPMAQHTDSRTVSPVNAGGMDVLNDPKGILAQRSVYFDYDKYDVKSEYSRMLTAHSTYLESHKARKVVIQGNTDDRGGSEYNLALGQKRAEAERKALEAMGVPETQMEAVSFGKEKPKAQGENEAAWSQNRRADLVYAK